MKYTENTRIEKSEDLVILVNIFNGLWFRMTQECFRILELFIQSRDEIETFLEKIQNDEDREYLRKTFLYLVDIGIIEEKKGTYMPENIGFSITHRCNLHCKHCSYCAGTCVDEEILSDKEIINILRKIISINPRSISITGGEPLVRNNVQEILSILENEYDGYCNLMTNATLISETNINYLIRTFDSFDISIDGIDEYTCGMIRGQGVFDKVMKNVDMLKKQGIPSQNISLSMVLTSENEKHVEEFERLNKKLGTNSIIREYSYIGRGEKNRLLEVDPESIGNIEFNFKKNLYHCMNCGAMKSEMYVNCDGEIYPCPMIIDKRYSLGNIIEIDNLIAFLKDEKYKFTGGYQNFMDMFSPEKINECRNCKNKYFCINCPVQHVQHQKQAYWKGYCKVKKAYHESLWER